MTIENYREEQARIEHRYHYLRINHPDLYEVAHPNPLSRCPSYHSSLLHSWMQAWCHSSESIERGLETLCKALLEENETLRKALLNSMTESLAPRVICPGDKE